MAGSNSRDAAAVLSHIRETQAFIKRFEDEDMDIEELVPEEAEEACILAEEVSRGKNGSKEVAAATETILQTSPPDQKAEFEELGNFAPRHPSRTTLSGALKGHETFASFHDDGLRLLCFLRMAPSGCDADVIPNPMHTRKLVMATPKRWHDLVRHQVALNDAFERLPAQRKSRVTAWVEATEKARIDCAPSLPSTLTISSGDFVAVQWQGHWRVGMVLTLWRHYKKGSGSQPCPRLCAKGSLHSARMVIMDQASETVYHADAQSRVIVLPVENVGVRLDSEGMDKKLALDGVKINLNEDIVFLFFFFLTVHEGLILCSPHLT